MNDYFENLRRMRQKVLGEETAVVDKMAAASPTKEPESPSVGLIQRRSAPQPTSKPVAADPNLALEKWIREMEDIRKTVKASRVDQNQPTVEGSKQDKTRKAVDEALGVKQKTEEVPFDRLIQTGTKKEITDRVSALSTVISQKLLPSVQQDTGFLAEVERVAKRFGYSKEDLLAVMHFETGGSFDPSTVNKAGSGATGLIQFTPKTAKSLGTSVETLAKMSRKDQMKYVEKYLEQYEGKLKGGKKEDLYMAILYPKAIGQDNNYVLFAEGTTAFKQNKGLDQNKDGKVTKGEAASKGLMTKKVS